MTAPPSQPRPRSRKGLVIGLSIGAALIVVTGAGAVAASAAISSATAPDRQVSEFLTDLVDGRAEAALAVMGERPSGLLTDAAYAASTNHITDFTVVGTATSGDTSTVTAEIGQGGTSYTQDFVLARAGKAFVFFDAWRLQPLALGLVDAQVDGPEGLSITIDGTSVETAAGSGLAAFPGDYEVAVDDSSDLFDAQPSTASVVGLSETAAGSVATAVVTTTLTEAGTAAGRTAVESYIDSCLAQASLAPVGCGFEARAQNGYTYSRIVWSLTTRPTVTFGDWSQGGWSVATETAGTLDVVVDATDAAGRSGPAGTTISNYRPAGTVTIVDGTAAFTPSVLPF